jgi:hypothetical protein
MLIKYRSAHIQHMQKALTLMNVRLTNVLSDITGVTGMKIIRSIVAGEHNPEVLASYRQQGCAKNQAEIAKSLEGNYKREHLFALQQALDLYDFYGQQLHDCDVELEALYQDFDLPDEPCTPPPDPRKTKRRKNQPYFDLGQSLYRMTGVDLTQIDGLDTLTVQDTAFRMAAQSLARSDCALGAFYRRIRARHGGPKAVTATAHKLARIVYFMLKKREPYRDPGAYYYEEQYRIRAIRNLQRRASKLGMRLEPVGLT